MTTKSTRHFDLTDEYIKLVMEYSFSDQAPEVTDLIAKIGKLIDTNQLNDAHRATVALLLRMAHMGTKVSSDTLKTAHSILSK